LSNLEQADQCPDGCPFSRHWLELPRCPVDASSKIMREFGVVTADGHRIMFGAPIGKEMNDA
jgi:hypothetical protein